jgi:hypothetical protein
MCMFSPLPRQIVSRDVREPSQFILGGSLLLQPAVAPTENTKPIRLKCLRTAVLCNPFRMIFLCKTPGYGPPVRKHLSKLGLQRALQAAAKIGPPSSCTSSLELLPGLRESCRLARYAIIVGFAAAAWRNDELFK